jgi:Uma2 family endonuclease
MTDALHLAACCHLPNSVFWASIDTVQAVEHAGSISAEDYLAGELKSPIRHEYIGGVVYAMAGTGTVHNIMIESLQEYILVAQDQTEVTVFRRAGDWRPEVANRPQQQLRIESLDFTLSLPAIYQSALPAN